MNICHVIIGLNIGGAEKVLKRLVESHLEHQNLKITVVSLTNKGDLGRDFENAGAQVKCLNIKNVLDAFFAFYKLIQIIKHLNPNIVQTWMYHADLFGGLAARFAGCRNVVWNIRSSDITKGGRKTTIIVRWFCSLLSRKIPKKIICVAESSKELHKKIGYYAPKMVVIPNGFSLKNSYNKTNKGAFIKNELGLEPETKIILSVGRFHPVKDHITLINAINHIHPRHSNFKILLIGKGLSQNNELLMNWINATRKPEYFILLEKQNDIKLFMDISDIFCLHSVSEGFPNVLGEAMSSGLPCITTNVGDAATLLGNKTWIVPSKSPKILGKKLTEMLDFSVIERKKMGQCNVARIQEHFKFEKISSQYFQLYFSIFLKQQKS